MKNGKLTVVLGILACLTSLGLTLLCVTTVVGRYSRSADEAYAAVYAELSKQEADKASDGNVVTIPQKPVETPPAGEVIGTLHPTESATPGIDMPEPSVVPGEDGIDIGNGHDPDVDPSVDKTPDDVNGSTDISDTDVKDRFLENEFTTVEEDGTVVYHIQRGDTLTKISGIFGVSVDELAEYNHIRNVNLIYTGSALRIPTENWEQD